MLDLLVDTRYDIVFLDNHFGVGLIDSLEVVRRIRAMERVESRYKGEPVLIIGATSSESEEFNRSARAVGMQHVIGKPYKAPQLERALSVCRDHRRAQIARRTFRRAPQRTLNAPLHATQL